MEKNDTGNCTSFFLSDIVGAKVLVGEKKIGWLSDMVIKDGKELAEVTHFLVGRPWGDPSLLVPMEKVGRIFPLGRKEVLLEISSPEGYEGEPGDAELLLKDYILDKKVLDTEGREVEVVYDIKLALRGRKLYVTQVDVSRYAFFKRMHMGGLAEALYGPRELSKGSLIPWGYVDPLSKMGSFAGEVRLNIIKDKMADMRPVDIADMLQEMPPEQRTQIFEGIDTERASAVLEKIDPNVQRDLVKSLKKAKVAKLVDAMTPGQAADVLAALPWSDSKVILGMLEKEHAAKVNAIIEKDEEKASNFATRDYIRVSPVKTASQVRSEYATIAKGKKVVMYLYVVDSKGVLLGVLDIKELLEAKDGAHMRDIMIKSPICLTPDSTLKEAHQIFTRYSFRSVPVADKSGRMLGVLPYRDVMHLTHRFVE